MSDEYRHPARDDAMKVVRMWAAGAAVWILTAVLVSIWAIAVGIADIIITLIPLTLLIALGSALSGETIREHYFGSPFSRSTTRWKYADFVAALLNDELEDEVDG